MERKNCFYSLFNDLPGKVKNCCSFALDSSCSTRERKMYKIAEIKGKTDRVKNHTIKYWGNRDFVDWMDNGEQLRRKLIGESKPRKIPKTQGPICRTVFSPKPDMSLPMDLLLDSISMEEKGINFNFTLINSIVLKFLDHKRLASFLSIEPIFKFTEALPLTLVAGYIYLEKYVRKIRATFSDCSKLIKFFLVCCFIGSKFTYDTHYSSDSFLTEWKLMAKEINYIEGLVLSTINYDIEISNRDIQKVLIQNVFFSNDKKSLDSHFHEAIGWWEDELH